MKRIFMPVTFLVLAAGPAASAEMSPIGDWRVKDGYANIRIDNCGGKLWGIVAWEQKAGFDTENPDPTKKGRPILGMPILLAMAPTKPNLWEGEIYNSQNGKMYMSKISLVDENTLKLEGCVLGGLFCGGENWTRVTTPPTGGISLPTAQTKSGQTKGTTKGAPPPQSEVCARVAEDTSAAQNTKGTAKK
jgi:uncharacterized protein (DUF2147 family)